MVTLHEVITFLMLFLHLEVKPLMTLTTVLYLSCALISGHLAKPLFRSDRKSGSAGMPRPSSYPVFCLKEKHTLLASILHNPNLTPRLLICEHKTQMRRL